MTAYHNFIINPKMYCRVFQYTKTEADLTYLDKSKKCAFVSSPLVSQGDRERVCEREYKVFITASVDSGPAFISMLLSVKMTFWG